MRSRIAITRFTRAVIRLSVLAVPSFLLPLFFLRFLNVCPPFVYYIIILLAVCQAFFLNLCEKIPGGAPAGVVLPLFFSGEPFHRHAQNLSEYDKLVVGNETVAGLYFGDSLPLDSHASNLHTSREVCLREPERRSALVDTFAGYVPLSLVLIYPQISASSRLPLDCNTFSR